MFSGIPDTSILDTSTEDAEELATPKKGPAARTTRRASSSRLAATPAAKVIYIIRHKSCQKNFRLIIIEVGLIYLA